MVRAWFACKILRLQLRLWNLYFQYSVRSLQLRNSMSWNLSRGLRAEAALPSLGRRRATMVFYLGREQTLSWGRPVLGLACWPHFFVPNNPNPPPLPLFLSNNASLLSTQTPSPPHKARYHLLVGRCAFYTCFLRVLPTPASRLPINRHGHLSGT
jgi:hypothetical protein